MTRPSRSPSSATATSGRRPPIVTTTNRLRAARVPPRRLPSPPHAVAEAAAERATGAIGRRHDLVKLEPGEYPVVLAPAAIAEMLGWLALSAFNGLAHAEGRGALVGRLGTRLVAPSINLSDSPRYPRTLPRAFDPEGIPKSPL